MLNVSTVEREVHTDNLLVVCVDVSKDKLDLYADHTDPAESQRQELDGQIPNRSGETERSRTHRASKGKGSFFSRW